MGKDSLKILKSLRIRNFGEFGGIEASISWESKNARLHISSAGTGDRKSFKKGIFPIFEIKEESVIFREIDNAKSINAHKGVFTSDSFGEFNVIERKNFNTHKSFVTQITSGTLNKSRISVNCGSAFLGNRCLLH